MARAVGKCRLVDGATCPSDDVSTYGKKQEAYRLLLERGLIRVGLPMPSAGLEFKITEVIFNMIVLAILCTVVFKFGLGMNIYVIRGVY